MLSIADPLEIARHLARLGVPVFTAGLAPDGRPVGANEWQHTPPGDLTPVDTWQPGLALCAVMGHVFDVLDIDPRHGGTESARVLAAELGGELPRFYAKAATPSGGWHYWMAPLGLAKKTSFRPGLDYQGGQADGTGRGFVFLPPTVRPSKADGTPRPYRWLEEPCSPDPADRSGAALAAVILATRTPATTVRQARSGKPLEVASGYVRAALTRELDAVATAGEGARNTQLNRSAFALARFAADGLLDADAVADALAEAAESAGLGYAETVNTIRSAFTARGAA